jgi:hypothetical protein
VHCQLEFLARCLPGRIRYALDELPSTLDATYERTLQEIDSTNWEFASRLLHCVAVASRPLRVTELAEFLAFDFHTGDIPKYREDWRLEDPVDAMLSTCSTLLSLVNAEYSQVIHFSHFSVKQFLTSSRLAEKRNTISSHYHVSMTPAHTIVAKACLGILLHLDKDGTRGALPRSLLANYAAEHWFEHARFQGVSHKLQRKECYRCLTEKNHTLEFGSRYATRLFTSGARRMGICVFETPWSPVTLCGVLRPIRCCESPRR